MTESWCRGCAGTCCTGVGSEPCTCSEPAAPSQHPAYTDLALRLLTHPEVVRVVANRLMEEGL